MRKPLTASLVLLLLLSVPLQAFSAEIKGKVVSVSGTTVRIEIDPEFLPDVGDKLEISDFSTSSKHASRLLPPRAGLARRV